MFSARAFNFNVNQSFCKKCAQLQETFRRLMGPMSQNDANCNVDVLSHRLQLASSLKRSRCSCSRASVKPLENQLFPCSGLNTASGTESVDVSLFLVGASAADPHSCKETTLKTALCAPESSCSFMHKAICHVAPRLYVGSPVQCESGRERHLKTEVPSRPPRPFGFL